MKLHKITYAVYSHTEKRFIKQTKYYADWYLKYHNLDLKKEFSKGEYNNMEIETFNVDKDEKWHWLNGTYYKEFPMSKGVL